MRLVLGFYEGSEDKVAATSHHITVTVEAAAAAAAAVGLFRSHNGNI